MISHLTGTVLSKWPKSIILDVSGVGYKVSMAPSHLALVNESADISLFIHTAVREDDISLYGFRTADELSFFQKLISVSRIGPKVALEIINNGSSAVQKAIVEKNLAFLSHISGLGKKTAERLLVELDGKISLSDEASLKSLGGGSSEDVIDALMRLGYQRNHITSVLKKLPTEVVREEDVITFFLKSV
ncbi:MAG: Holliday junction branch migration protein RuvA [Patescibacteria group bacterium]